jgi:hypothetical protein
MCSHEGEKMSRCEVRAQEDDGGRMEKSKRKLREEREERDRQKEIKSEKRM